MFAETEFIFTRITKRELNIWGVAIANLTFNIYCKSIKSIGWTSPEPLKVFFFIENRLPHRSYRYFLLNLNINIRMSGQTIAAPATKWKTKKENLIRNFLNLLTSSALTPCPAKARARAVLVFALNTNNFDFEIWACEDTFFSTEVCAYLFNNNYTSSYWICTE